MKPAIVLPVLVVAAGLAAAAAAHNPGPAPAHGPGAHFERMILHLDLSADQKQAIGELLDANRAEMDSLGGRASAAHKALHEAILAETPDEGAIRDAAQSVGAFVTDRAIAHARLLNEVRALLTPDQRRKLEELITEHLFHGPHPWH